MNIAQRVIDHFGGVGQTAQALQVTRETLRLWRRDGVPLENAIWLEQATKGVITAEDVLAEARQAS